MKLNRNSNDVLVGVCGGVTRIASHLYTVASNTDETVTYTVYVASLSPQVARCTCMNFIVSGNICKHGKAAIDFERYIKKVDPTGYADEKAATRERIAKGYTARPYRGSKRDEMLPR